MSGGVKPQKICKFRRYLQKYCKASLRVIEFDQSILDSLPIFFSVEVYMRLFAQFLLPNDLDRVLYLDADIIVLQDLQKFYNQDFGGNYYVAAADFGENNTLIASIKSAFGIQDKTYVNSGVLLMNLSALREHTSFDEILSKLHEWKNKLKLPDQDFLNAYFKDNIKICSGDYNYQLGVEHSVSKEKLKNIFVLHYTYEKPWSWNSNYSKNKYYCKVRLAQGHLIEYAVRTVIRICYYCYLSGVYKIKQIFRT